MHSRCAIPRSKMRTSLRCCDVTGSPWSWRTRTGKWPLIREVTGDCVYVRLHGDEELYASGYSDDVLRDWAWRIRSWSMGGDALDATNLGSPIERRPGGRDVYVYFDNDVKTHAPF